MPVCAYTHRMFIHHKHATVFVFPLHAAKMGKHASCNRTGHCQSPAHEALTSVSETLSVNPPKRNKAEMNALPKPS